MLRRLFLVSLALLLVVAFTAVADARSSSAPARPPVIRSVSPMSAGIGDTLTIRGAHFVPGRRRDIVVFKRDGGRAVFVKATSATRTRIRVRVPGKLAEFLPSRADGTQGAARFRLRILTRRLGRRFTSREKSPTIGPRGYRG